MKLLIIGGSGHISGTLCRMALAQGDDVWIVTRGKRPIPEGVHHLLADRHEAGSLEKAITQAGVHWDLVVDCIAYELVDIRQDIALFPGKTGHFVFLSSDWVFDPPFRKFPQPENSDHFIHSGDGRQSKWQCEQELMHTPAQMSWTVFRACHVYGPGSDLGCMPLHARDTQLIDRLRKGQTLKLVGGGHFLQQPIFGRDLTALMLACPLIAKARRQIFNVAGPDIVESRQYYQIIADELGVGLKIEEVPVEPFIAEHPDLSSFICHRIYRLDKITDSGLPPPATSLVDGLREHVQWKLAQLAKG